jgi:uncharacterized membrane protein
MSGAEFGVFAAIIAMALTNTLIRFSGYFLMARVPLTPRLTRMLEALPGSVVAATLVPLALKSGSAAVIGLSVVVILMAWRRNEFLAVFGGLALIALMRAGGL